MMHKLAQLRKSTDKVLQSPEGCELMGLFETFAEQEWAGQVDVLLPWIVREWKDDRIVLEGGILHYRKGENTHRLPLRRYVEWFHSNAPSRKGFNIMEKSSTVETVWEKVGEGWRWAEEKRKTEVLKSAMQGEAVFTFPDGWTIQRLVTAEQLDWEGEKMTFCLGNGLFDSQTEDELILFYSLRDDKGKPHVTLDVTPHWMRNKETGQLTRYPKTRCNSSPDWFNADEWAPQLEHATLNSCYGPSDSAPKDIYAQRLSEWMESLGGHRIRARGVAHAPLEAMVIDDWERVEEVLGDCHLGNRLNRYGMLQFGQVNYIRLARGLAQEDRTKEQADLLAKLACERKEEGTLKEALWKIACQYRFQAGPGGLVERENDEEQVAWEDSKYFVRLEIIASKLDLDVPPNAALEAAVTKKAKSEKRKSSLPRAWRHWVREQDKIAKEAS